MTKFNFIGWTRHGSGKGDVSKYHLRHYCNAITSFCGGVSGRIPTQGCTTPRRMC